MAADPPKEKNTETMDDRETDELQRESLCPTTPLLTQSGSMTDNGGNPSLSQIFLSQDFEILSQKTIENYVKILADGACGDPTSIGMISLTPPSQALAVSGVGPVPTPGTVNGNIATTVIQEIVPPATSGGPPRLMYHGLDVQQSNIPISQCPVFYPTMYAATMFQETTMAPSQNPGFPNALLTSVQNMASNRSLSPRNLDSVSPELYPALPQVVPAVTPVPAATSAPTKVHIPVSESYDSGFGFEVLVTKGADKKSPICTYSEMLNSLYVIFKELCPISFKCTGPNMPPAGSKIRAMITFTEPQHLADVVRRCSVHANEDAHHSHSRHVLQAQHDACEVIDDPFTRRHSVMVPWEAPGVGVDHITVLYRFMCRNSCAGTMNRRKTQIIFTLEHNGTVLGRQTMGLRICSCPGRDKEKDEEKQYDQQALKRFRQSHLPSSTSKKRRCGYANPKGNFDKTSGDLTALREPAANIIDRSELAPGIFDEDDDKVYYLPIRGRKMYDFMQLMYKNFFTDAEKYRRLAAASAQDLDRGKAQEKGAGILDLGETGE